MSKLIFNENDQFVLLAKELKREIRTTNYKNKLRECIELSDGFVIIDFTYSEKWEFKLINGRNEVVVELYPSKRNLGMYSSIWSRNSDLIKKLCKIKGYEYDKNKMYKPNCDMKNTFSKVATNDKNFNLDVKDLKSLLGIFDEISDNYYSENENCDTITINSGLITIKI